jgi:prepilin-type N-terminal cleavage/methylation domain-containing protein
MNEKAFTLIEVLLAAAILAVCLSGLLMAYVDLLIFTDLSRDMTLATNAAQAKMEEIRNMNFSSLAALDGTNFTITGFNSTKALGVIEVADTSYDDLKRVRLAVSFKSRNRVIGEDQNLNGVWNSGEDFSGYSNGTGKLNSPVEAVTLIANYTN